MSPADLRRGVDLFIEHAYNGSPPARALRYLPPAGPVDPELFLMSDIVERTPDVDSFEDVRSFALRIGCTHYRHLKLRLARAGTRSTLVFMVDSHDAFLEAPPGSPDHEGLEQLKRANAEMSSRIVLAWEEAGLQTEKSLLRRAIQRVKSGAGPAGCP